MAETVKKGGWLRAVIVGALGMGGGAAGTYATSVVDKIARAPLPVANFAVASDGLNLTCQNHATGDSGWWDFGDGTPLEPFAPATPAVAHAYAKPGTYTVKLVVRNFTADENERAVAVEVAPGASAPAAPQIGGFAVQPVSSASVAPATFRITADVKDAERCVWDFGDGRLEVADAGKIDRLVTFEKPGAFPIQLVAHNARAASKQAASVKVDAPKSGTLLAVLKVTDSGTKVERVSRTETVAVPAPKDKSRPAFTRTVAARPGFTLAAADPANPNTPGVRNLKVAVAADKKSATVTGEWAGDKSKPAGSDLLVPLKLVEERAMTTQPVVSMVSCPLPALNTTGKVSTVLPLPEAPTAIDGHKRAIHVEVREFGPDGKPKIIAAGPMNGRGPAQIESPLLFSFGITTPRITTAISDVDAVKVTVEQLSPLFGGN